MKKLLALLLALLTVAAFTACSNDGEGGEDTNDAYKKDDTVITEITDDNGDTFHFVNKDSETVTITKFESTVDAPHEVKIPAYLDGKRVVGIGKEAFSGISNVSKVIFPTEEELVAGDKNFLMKAHTFEIEPYAFRNCDGLIELAFPAYVSFVGESAFYGCLKLAKVTFAEESILSELQATTFMDCKALKSIVVPGSVKNILKGAFFGCTALETVTLSEGVMNVGAQAFQNCKTLSAVSLPLTTASLGENAFSGSEKLIQITYKGENESVISYIEENFSWIDLGE